MLPKKGILSPFQKGVTLPGDHAPNLNIRYLENKKRDALLGLELSRAESHALLSSEFRKYLENQVKEAKRGRRMDPLAKMAITVHNKKIQYPIQASISNANDGFMFSQKQEEKKEEDVLSKILQLGRSDYDVIGANEIIKGGGIIASNVKERWVSGFQGIFAGLNHFWAPSSSKKKNKNLIGGGSRISGGEPVISGGGSRISGIPSSAVSSSLKKTSTRI